MLSLSKVCGLGKAAPRAMGWQVNSRPVLLPGLLLSLYTQGRFSLPYRGPGHRAVGCLLPAEVEVFFSKCYLGQLRIMTTVRTAPPTPIQAAFSQGSPTLACLGSTVHLRPSSALHHDYQALASQETSVLKLGVTFQPRAQLQ